MRPVLACVLLATMAAASARADTLYFALQGTNPGGNGSYRGTVALTEVSNGQGGEKAGVVTWRVNNSAPVVGIALSTADSPTRLSISFPGKPVPGVALGTMMQDGSLQLLWYVGGKAAGTEVWTPTQP